MQFKGHLLLPDEPGPGLRVHLDVAEHHLAVESDGGGLGAWPLEVVNVERLRGDVFSLSVAGEPLRFVADDSISFVYSGMPAIERVSGRPRSRSPFRSMLGRIWKGPDRSGTVEIPPEPPVEDAETGASDLTPEPPIESPLVESIADWEVVATAAEVVDVEPKVDDPIADIGPGVAVEPREETRASTEEQKVSAPVEVPIESPSCPTILDNGRRCESTILMDSGYCYPHDPKRAFEDKYKAAQEARAQLRRDSTERLNRIYNRLDKAMRQVERGDLDPETATAMAQLARTMCAILEIDDTPSGER